MGHDCKLRVKVNNQHIRKYCTSKYDILEVNQGEEYLQDFKFRVSITGYFVQSKTI